LTFDTRIYEINNGHLVRCVRVFPSENLKKSFKSAGVVSDCKILLIPYCLSIHLRISVLLYSESGECLSSRRAASVEDTRQELVTSFCCRWESLRIMTASRFKDLKDALPDVRRNRWVLEPGAKRKSLENSHLSVGDVRDVHIAFGELRKVYFSNYLHFKVTQF